MPELNLPIPEVTPGPEWASQLNEAITTINDEIDTGRLSEPELSATFVQFRNFDGSAVAAGSVVVITLTEDGTDIHDITVEEA